jgi:triosephosphate isomerase
VCQALSSKLKVILCIGERERDSHATYLSFVTEEIVSALKAIKEVDFKNITIAYEPIWAIGKSAEEAITSDDLEEMVLYIKKMLHEHFGEKAAKAIKVLYGGSVDEENVQDLLVPGLDGFLVGRASTSKEALSGLIKALDA